MNIVAYHIDSLPEDYTIEDILEIYYATKVLIHTGPRPYILDSNNLDEDRITIINKTDVRD